MEAKPTQTFLFADLVGFTALTGAQGDEAAADLAIAFNDEVSRLARQHRAETVKSIGDAVMVRAGDAVEAVRLALRIVGELDHRHGFPPIRIGMHTGSAVNRRNDWFGAAVNLAARVAAAARGGEVLITETTRAAIGREADVSLTDLGIQSFRGVPSPLPVYAAAPDAVRPALTRRRPARLEPVPALAAGAAS